MMTYEKNLLKISISNMDACLEKINYLKKVKVGQDMDYNIQKMIDEEINALTNEYLKTFYTLKTYINDPLEENKIELKNSNNLMLEDLKKNILYNDDINQKTKKIEKENQIQRPDYMNQNFKIPLTPSNIFKINSNNIKSNNDSIKSNVSNFERENIIIDDHKKDIKQDKIVDEHQILINHESNPDINNDNKIVKKSKNKIMLFFEPSIIKNSPVVNALSIFLISMGVSLSLGATFLLLTSYALPLKVSGLNFASQVILYIMDVVPGIPFPLYKLLNYDLYSIGLISLLLCLNLILLGISLVKKIKYTRHITIIVFLMSLFFDFYMFITYGINGALSNMFGVGTNIIILFYLVNNKYWK